MGERVSKGARERGILLMLCDQCALEHGPATGKVGACEPRDAVAGVGAGCFLDLYPALARNPPDHIITL